MKLVALEIFYKDPATAKVTQLYATHELSTFSFFQRSRYPFTHIFFSIRIFNSDNHGLKLKLSCALYMLRNIKCVLYQIQWQILSFFHFSVKEFMNFTSKIIAERTTMGSRASVKEQGMSVKHTLGCNKKHRLILISSVLTVFIVQQSDDLWVCQQPSYNDRKCTHQVILTIY